ncbi:interleukin-8b.3 [Pimephales promelas]|uniref:interleukin-8b.3 n=1 Tax=Pimephales promelas TaxID=90988 RepID=UPI00195592A8|nr:interleukin-8b.3 [Pimephales promelas]
MKFNVAAFLLLTCMTLLCTNEVFARLIAPQLRCPCVGTYSGKRINPKLIQNIQTIPAGVKCKTLQIIVTLKQGQTCLNPNDEWVKKIIEG